MKTNTMTVGSTRFTGSARQLRETERKLLAVFGKIIMLDIPPGDYPRWSDSTGRLMELAWVLWKTRRIFDPQTARPMTLQHIAERLCRSLHRPLPANVSWAALQSRRSRRQSVLTTYGRLWFEGGVSPAATIEWQETKPLPRLRSYRGVF